MYQYKRDIFNVCIKHFDFLLSWYAKTTGIILNTSQVVQWKWFSMIKVEAPINDSLEYALLFLSRNYIE